jgi:hypothetical protein
LGIEIGAAGKSLQIYPSDILLEEAPQQKGLTGAKGQAPVGQEYQHLKMGYFFMLLQ